MRRLLIITSVVAVLVVASPASASRTDYGVRFPVTANTVREFCVDMRANDQSAANAHGNRIVVFRCARVPLGGGYQWAALYERYADGTEVGALYRLDFRRNQGLAWSPIL